MPTTVPHRLRLILGGILSLPALLVLVIVAPLIVILSFPAVFVLVRRKHSFFFPPARPSSSKPVAANAPASSSPPPLLSHAIISGGSSGIGLSCALELARRGCRTITLLARDEGRLAVAKAAVEREAAEATTMTVVRTVSVDVTDVSSLERTAAFLCGDKKDGGDNHNDHDSPNGNGATAAGGLGPPTLLFGCAGYATPKSFGDLTSDDFRRQMDVNYLGSVHFVQAFLPYLIGEKGSGDGVGDSGGSRGGGGTIVLTSSMAGQTGIYGYSAYSPAKFALRGFAESLSAELDSAAGAGAQVNVCLAYPPDTDTPGYKQENLTKPEACRRISETNGLWDPAAVASKMVAASLRSTPPFDIYFGMDGWMLSCVTAGMNPATTIWDGVCQVALMGLCRFICFFYLMDFAGIAKGCHDEEERGGVERMNGKKEN